MSDSYNPNPQTPEEPSKPESEATPFPSQDQVVPAPAEYIQEQPQYNQEAYGQAQYGQYYTPATTQPQYDQSQYAQPNYDPTQYAQSQYGQPQYDQFQYDQSQYGQQQYAQPQYAQAQYAQPQYGQTPAAYPAPAGAQQKSRLTAGLLGLLLPYFAAHNFYLGFTGKAVLQLLLNFFTFGLTTLWPFIEGILYLVSKDNPAWSVDANNVPLRD